MIRLTENDLALLREIAAENVTWEDEYRRRGNIVKYRLWSSEHDYVPCTARAKRLEAAGLIERWTGVRFGRGGVALTPVGNGVLGESGA